MNLSYRVLPLAMALLAAASAAHAEIRMRVPMLEFKAPKATAPAAPSAAASGAFALQSEVAGASGRASTFLADSSCKTALGASPALTFWLNGASTTAVSYNAGTGAFTVILPTGGNGSTANLVLADSISGKQCDGSATVYSQAGWWPVTMSAGYAADGSLTTSLSSPGFSASNSMCTGADSYFQRDQYAIYSLTGTPVFTGFSTSSTVCIPSVPEIAKAFSYTNGVTGESWTPVGDARTTINSAVVTGKGNSVVLVDPYVSPRVHLVTTAGAGTSYRATGSVISGATDPRYMSYFTVWVIGQVDRDVPMSLADWVADDSYWLDDYPTRPLYSTTGAWTYPNGELARTIVHAVIP